MTERIEPFAFATLDEIRIAAGDLTVQGIGLGPQSVAVIAGQPNTGKTSAGIDLGQHVALGEPWLGLKTRRVAVVYFAPEAPASAKMRARAAAERKFPGQKLPFVIVDNHLDLGGDYAIVDVGRVIATIRSVSAALGDAVGLVFIDTAASALGNGQENGDGMVMLSNCAKRIAIETNCCVVLIHHPPKGDGAKGLRGHGSLAGAADTILEITNDDSSGVRTLTLTKSRDTATGLQRSYRLEVVELPEADAWGDPVTTVIVQPALNHKPGSKQTCAKPSGANQLRAMTALREWARSNPNATFISSADIKALFEAHDIGRQRRPEVLNYLCAAGVLSVSVGGNTLHQEMLT